MSKEIQNNDPGWRQRLDRLEGIPGEAPLAFFNTWEKLNSRLELKRRNNKSLWWFIAAACTVALFLLLTFDQQPGKKIEGIAVTGKEKPLKILLYRPAAIVKAKSYPHKKKSFAPIKIEIPQIKEDTAIQIAAPIMADVNNNPHVAAFDNVLAPPAKKWRVIHINELEGNGDEEKKQWAYDGKTKVKHAKSKKLIRSYVSNSTSDKILKISLSPSN